MTVYIGLAYLLFLMASAVGAFSKSFSANVTQRIALCLLAIWTAARLTALAKTGWHFPNEAVVATALALYAAGTVAKTRAWIFVKEALQ